MNNNKSSEILFTLSRILADVTFLFTSTPCAFMYFLLLLDSSSKNRELSSIDQLNRVKVRPLLHVTLTMKQTSHTRTSPKYTFARSLKIPTEREYRLCAMTSERGGRHSFLYVTVRKHTKWQKFLKIQIAETTADLGKIKFKAYSGE